jgi:hypothetical protein
VIAVALNSVAGVNTRICRPVGLEPRDCRRVCQYAIERLGLKYDLRDIIDLARYLLPANHDLRWHASGRPDGARYDVSWQYRMTPAEYPDWGLVSEWDVV